MKKFCEKEKCKSLILLCLFGMFGISANAFQVGEFEYEDNGDGTVTVTGLYEDPNEPKNEISIPSSISYGGVTYDVTKIGYGAFREHMSLAIVALPNTIESIDEFAFYYCTSLKSINIPNSVRSIGRFAFRSCNLKSIDLPNSITCIETDVFSFCPFTNLVIPNSVKEIQGEAFQGCHGLTSVTIPNGVEYLSGFNDCSNLTSVTISNSVTTIGDGAFSGCTRLSNVNIPNSVTAIGSGAFNECKGLTNISIPYSVTAIGPNAFANCSNLTNLNLSNSITTIYQYAFFNCWGLTSISIPNSTKTIGESAFENCVGLTTVVIGKAVQSIDQNAFSNNGNLRDVTFLGAIPPMLYSVFNNTENIVFHVPEGCKEDYLASQDVWKDYYIVEGAYNFEAVDATDNTIGRIIDYEDKDNNTVTLLDSYKSLTVQMDTPLKQITYTRTFNNTNWQALYVPFEIPVTAEFLEDFEVAYMNNVHQYDEDDDGTIDRTVVEFFKMKSGTLKANYPYVIKAKTTGAKTITVNEATLYATAENSVDCRSTQYEYVFKGIYSRMMEDELTGCYAMSGGGWKTLSAGSYLNAFRVYLKVTPRESGLAPLKSIGMRIIGEDGDVTEIQTPLLQEGTEEVPAFDLAGRRVEHPTQGIYIVNGKKVVIK